MEKKDIYEHLADIYLDASAKRRNKRAKKYPNILKGSLAISIVAIVILASFTLTIQRKNKHLSVEPDNNKPLSSELALILRPDVVKLNFNFEVAKEEVYSINMHGLDMLRFKTLAFSIRKASYQNNTILKVELISTANEKSNLYIHRIPAYRWQEHKINLSDFKDINDWSKISNLSFIVEAGNMENKQGIIYIDNVRLLR